MYSGLILERVNQDLLWRVYYLLIFELPKDRGPLFKNDILSAPAESDVVNLAVMS